MERLEILQMYVDTVDKYLKRRQLLLTLENVGRALDIKFGYVPSIAITFEICEEIKVKRAK